MLILRKKTEDCLQKNDRLVYFITVDPYEIRKEIRKEIPNREYRRTARPEKTIADLALSLAFLLTCLPAALAVDLNVDAGFYFKQSRGGTCTLASAAMMLRRRAYFDGLSDWTNVTENSVRSTAWANGLAHSFTYKEMQVGYATLLPGCKAKRRC